MFHSVKAGSYREEMLAHWIGEECGFQLLCIYLLTSGRLLQILISIAVSRIWSATLRPHSVMAYLQLPNREAYK